ncbi:hypothetical protein BGW42_006130 [Actinomortierella wolfii]|nr:hypothetical protein BGW42_006130 [Actinomortierella wolfii]
MASSHGGRPSDDRPSMSFTPGNLSRANPVRPQVSLPILPPLPITKEGKEAKDQAQQWEMSLNRIFQTMQSEDIARYLAYFKARLEVEEAYIRGLEKLVVPPKNFKATGSNNNKDGSANSGTSYNNSNGGGRGGGGGNDGSGGSGNSGGDGGGTGGDTEEIPTTLHMALDSLLASTVRAAASRRQFSDMLRNISGALANLKENHERLRKKQKEEAKPIFQLYAEIRLSTLPKNLDEKAKAKRTYEQKCREVDLVYSMDENDHSSMRERLKNLASSGPAGRLIKCRREMEEAENEYKNIVNMLEIYRQKREEAWESSLKLMQNMINERGTKTRQCLQAYVNGEREMIRKGADEMDRLSVAVECVKPVGDADQICMTFTRDASSHPKPVQYESFHNKKAVTGIFGMSLIDYAKKYDQNVPLVVLKCTEAIDRYGLKKEGIYRVSGRHAQITNLRKAFEADERQVDLTDPSAAEEVHAIAAILKAYLREMPEPLFPFPLNERVAYSSLTGGQARMQELKGRLKRLDDCHLDTLQILIQHLRRVYENVEDNKMNLDNISLIFTPAIFHDFNSAGSGPQAASQAAQQQYQQQQQQQQQLQPPHNVSTGPTSIPSSPGNTNAPPASDQQTSPTVNSFSAGNNAVSTAASWSSDHVLADLILNSHKIFNVLPKLPSRGNSMAPDVQLRSIETRLHQQHLHGTEGNNHSHPHHNTSGGGGMAAHHRDPRGSMGYSGATSMSPRSDSLGPFSNASSGSQMGSPGQSYSTPYLSPQHSQPGTYHPPPHMQQHGSQQLNSRHSSPHLNEGAAGYHSPPPPPYSTVSQQQQPQQQREYPPPPQQQQGYQGAQHPYHHQQQHPHSNEYSGDRRSPRQQPSQPKTRYSPHGSEVSLSSRSINTEEMSDLL